MPPVVGQESRRREEQGQRCRRRISSVQRASEERPGWLASAPLTLPISGGGLCSSFLDGLSRVPCAGAAALNRVGEWARVRSSA
ncbi:MAG: hypothetical protein M3546_17930 [Actinomycetota bacterium]|nr:hypothetical protein [Actinomycetota bacterium]